MSASGSGSINEQQLARSSARAGERSNLAVIKPHMGSGAIPVSAHTQWLLAGRKHRHDIGPWTGLLGARRATLFRRRDWHQRRVDFHDDSSGRDRTTEPRQRSKSIPAKLRTHCLEMDDLGCLWSGDDYGAVQLLPVPPRGPRLGAVATVFGGQSMARRLVYRRY